VFKDVIGQSVIKRRLTRAVNENRVSHAQLFLGKEGSGNLAIALAYAQYVMCQHPVAADACGTCSSCIKVQKLVHPDLHFAFPVNGEKDPVSDMFIGQWRQALRSNPYITEQEWYQAINLESKQGTIRVAEAEKITQKLVLKSFEGGYKILLIWLPERMRTEAANKLLKLIEEPPAKTLFLLVVENESLLLKTIRSRTQLVNLPPVDCEALSEMLQREHNLAQAEASALAHAANGSVVSARRLAGQGGSGMREYYEQFVLLMQLSYGSAPNVQLAKRGENLQQLTALAKRFAEQGREYQKSFLLYAMQMLRENFALNQNVAQAVYLSGEEAEWSAKFSPFINPRNVAQLYAEFNLAMQQLGQNGNPKIIFTDLALKIARLIRL
jgi:DNA polymerase-3 subunit delta'